MRVRAACDVGGGGGGVFSTCFLPKKVVFQGTRKVEK